MKTDIRLGLVVAIAFFGLSGHARADDDHDECTLRTLRGTYVFAASGHNIVGGVAQPKAIIEVLEFHGNGVLATTNGTLGVNGVTVHPLRDGGGYTVDASCVGTITFDAGPTFDMFFGPDGKKLWMIQTNKVPPVVPPGVFQGIATRVSRGVSIDRDRH